MNYLLIGGPDDGKRFKTGGAPTLNVPLRTSAVPNYDRENPGSPEPIAHSIYHLRRVPIKSEGQTFDLVAYVHEDIGNYIAAILARCENHLAEL